MPVSRFRSNQQSNPEITPHLLLIKQHGDVALFPISIIDERDGNDSLRLVRVRPRAKRIVAHLNANRGQDVVDLIIKFNFMRKLRVWEEADVLGILRMRVNASM